MKLFQHAGDGYLPADFVPDLNTYDILLVNSSAGKDSQALLDYVVELADERGAAREAHRRPRKHGPRRVAGDRRTGPRARRALRPALRRGRAQGRGPPRLRAPAPHVALRGGEVLYVRFQTGPDQAAHDFSRGRGEPPQDGPPPQGPEEARHPAGQGPEHDGHARPGEPCPGGQARVPAQRGRLERQEDRRCWLPIHEWSDAEVWERIRKAGTRPSPAYSFGMSRSSCSLCILASRADLVRAARLRPELADEYARLEAEIGHRFSNDLSMAEIIRLAEQAPGRRVGCP